MIKKDSIVIELTNVTKEYIIHHEKPTLVEKFIKGRDEKFLALKNINLTIKKGEKVGIIGPNGSGKTTLLKIITGITSPTSGSVCTNGKIVSLIDLEAGFHPDLTGFENIYLNGMLLGMKKSDIDKKLKKIINFADIHQFIDAPLFTYSSGMKLRLGFSVAIYAEPQILILDENFSVGDMDFQHKLNHKLNIFYKQNKTIIVVSHNLNFISQYSYRIIFLQNGSIYKDGKKEVLKKYSK